MLNEHLTTLLLFFCRVIQFTIASFVVIIIIRTIVPSVRID